MNKKRMSPKTVDAYIAGFHGSVQARLQKIRATIKRAAPDAEETISYGIPAFKLNGPLIYFAGFKAHIGFYPMTAPLRRQFKKELFDYLSSKATAKFPLDKPIPYPLIERVVRFRVQENLAADRANT